MEEARKAAAHVQDPRRTASSQSEPSVPRWRSPPKRHKPLAAVRSAWKKHTRSRSGPPTPRGPDIPRGCRPIYRRQRPDLLIFSGLFLARRLPTQPPGFEACEGSEAARRGMPASPFSSFPSAVSNSRRRRRCRGFSRPCGSARVSISGFVGWGPDGLGLPLGGCAGGSGYVVLGFARLICFDSGGSCMLWCWWAQFGLGLALVVL